MKKLTFLILLISITVSFAQTNAKRYQIKSGIVEYKLSGTFTGKEILYFDDYGMKEAKYTDSKMSLMGITQDQKTITILDNDEIISVDLNAKTATRMSNEILKEMLDGKTEKELQQLGEDMMKQLGGQKKANENFLEKSCEVWVIPSMKTKGWYYKLVPMKIEIDMMGKMISEAVKFEENVKISPDKFKVPAGIKVENVKY